MELFPEFKQDLEEIICKNIKDRLESEGTT